MKTIGLIVNQNRDVDLSYTKAVIALLQTEGFEVIVSKDFYKECPCEVVTEKNLFSNSDAIVTLGGDGTILSIAGFAATYNKPILGVNLGHLGYLTQLEKKEMSLLPTVLKSKPEFESRSMLQVTVVYKGGSSKVFQVLNDAVISRQITSNMLYVDLYANNKFVYGFQSDGLIFSTPTGSTAYSMSAGGPIVDTNLQNIILITPVSEHSFFSKSMIFSSEQVLSFVVKQDPEQTYLVLDGNNICSMVDVEKVTVQKSPLALRLFRLQDRNFYNVLNTKFSGRGEL